MACESYRVLKNNKICAIQMGDMRKNSYILPLGFGTMQAFENAGFKLKEIIIKEQYNCRATGFWKPRCMEHNFFLLAHEYLFIFKKLRDT